MQLGQIFKKSRKLSGLSQEALAEIMYMPRSTISKVENDKMELKISDAIRWFQATQAPEMLAAVLCGVDITTVIDMLSKLIGGFISYVA
ncbi:helix-turn-helix transcriptional regulator [Bacillus sp. S/N-304-OC-R1]|uniref:helix-turn-helix domain-containing protein n=1 Tax=Bacillus sp. S/N-304-OC-R1 TaxID=2758034 RepID=UPI001C8E1106|nr:helix-turn-helix transcriptional regulator [Bacillus sp. S/N-304-OC-R1]MBY0122192.1 helix-turn-helix transcriptional regulator [Bacillus sp. S/N-304-OC-R1]